MTDHHEPNRLDTAIEATSKRVIIAANTPYAVRSLVDKASRLAHIPDNIDTNYYETITSITDKLIQQSEDRCLSIEDVLETVKAIIDDSGISTEQYKNHLKEGFEKAVNATPTLSIHEPCPIELGQQECNKAPRRGC